MKYRIAMAKGRFQILNKDWVVVFESFSLAACEAWLDAQEQEQQCVTQ